MSSRVQIILDLEDKATRQFKELTGDMQRFAKATIKGNKDMTKSAAELSKKYREIQKRAERLATQAMSQGNVKRASMLADHARQAGQVADHYDKAGKKAGTFFDKLKAAKGTLIAAGAAMAGLAMAARKAWQMFEQGVAVERAERALIGYAGSAGEAVAVTREVQKATGYAVSEMSAMAMGAKLLSMGLATNAQEAGRLAEIAVTLCASMGKGPQEAFEQFTLLLANQSILRLDTFGISATGVRDRMEELVTEGMAPADRQGRFLAATMELAEAKLGQLAEAGFDASSAADEFGAAWEDLSNQLAVGVREALTPALEGWALFIRYRKELVRLRDLGVIDTAVISQENMQALHDYEIAIQRTEGELQRAADAQARLAQTGDVVVKSEEELQVALSGVHAALGDVTTAMLYQRAAAGLDADQALILARSMGVLNEESYIQITALDDLRAAYDDGTLSFGEYQGQVGDLILALDALKAAEDRITPAGIAAEMASTRQARAEINTWNMGIRGGVQRRLGGPVEAGGFYIVGEEGPEVFAPKKQGKILSHAESKALFTGTTIAAGSASSEVLARVTAAETLAQSVQQSVAEQREANAQMADMVISLNRNMSGLPREIARAMLSALSRVSG